jgi:hypothetical protein
VDNRFQVFIASKSLMAVIANPTDDVHARLGGAPGGVVVAINPRVLAMIVGTSERAAADWKRSGA